MSMTVGHRTVTIGGNYKSITQELMADGMAIMVDGHVITADAGQITIDGNTQILRARSEHRNLRQRQGPSLGQGGACRCGYAGHGSAIDLGRDCLLGTVASRVRSPLEGEHDRACQHAAIQLGDPASGHQRARDPVEQGRPGAPRLAGEVLVERLLERPGQGPGHDPVVPRPDPELAVARAEQLQRRVELLVAARA